MTKTKEKGRAALIVILLIWLAVASVVFGLTLTQRVSASLRRLPVYCVDTGGEKKVSLTFDAAWGDETTDGVLAILRENGVQASFFFVGDFAEKYPDTVRKIYNAGHDVGNHSMHHKDPTKQEYTDLCADIQQCSELLTSLTGTEPTLYRAPSGAYDNAVIDAADSLGMTAVQWDDDSIDWKHITAEKMTGRVLDKLSPGSIILFHLGRQNTLEALPAIIAGISERGYEIVPVSQLLIKGGAYVDPNGRQHPAA